MPVKEYKPEELNQQSGSTLPLDDTHASGDALADMGFNDVPADGSQSLDRMGKPHPFAAGMHNAGNHAVRSFLNPLLHPIDTAENAIQNSSDLLSMPKQVYGMYRQIKDEGAQSALPKIGGDILGGLALGEVAGGLGKGVGMAQEAMSNFRPTPSPDIVPPIQTASERLAGAVLPDAKRIPGFARDAASNAGTVQDFARRSANPLRTQSEFEAAIRGAGDERYNHFLEHILEPNMDVPVEGAGSVGQVHARISKINQLLDPNYQKLYPGEVDAALAKTTPESLKAEHDALVPKLHDTLSHATGIPADQIANLRQDFGSLRGMADTVQGARMARTARTGAADEGGIYPSKEGVLSKSFDTLRGGKTAIADRNFQKAWKGVNESSPPPPRPIPHIDPAFLRAKNLEQLSNVIPAELDAGASFGDRMRGMARMNAETQPQSKPFVPPPRTTELIPRRLLQPMPELNPNYGKVPDLRPTTTDLRPIPEGFGEQMRQAAKERSQMRKGN